MTTAPVDADENQSPRAATERRWLILRLFVIALAFMLVRDVVGDIYQQYLYVNNVFTQSQSVLQEINLGYSILGFFLFPCLPFVAYYLLAGEVDLREQLKPAVISLFLGGLIGSFVGSFFYFAISYGTNAPSFIQLVEVEYGNAINIASLVLFMVEDGLYSVFIGVAAVYIQAARRKQVTAPPLSEGQDAQAPAASAASAG